MTDRYLQRAALLVVFGLATELLCVLYTRPSTFLLFLGVGAPALLLGIGLI